MTVEHRHDRIALTPRSMLGIFIIVVGVIAALDQLHVLSASAVQPYWPLGVVAVGGVMFLQNRAQGNRGVNGVLVIGLGLLLLLNTLGDANVHVWDLMGPAILILIGWALVRRGPLGFGTAAQPEDGRMVIFAALSGVKRASTATHFKGGEVTTFMGGCVLDLRQAILSPGEEATLDVLSVMGGCEIAVPSSWTVSTPIVPIMGGVEDKRLPPLPVAPGSTGTLAAPHLVLRGFVMMGGVVIKS